LLAYGHCLLLPPSGRFRVKSCIEKRYCWT
jgi:hypothetical protein